PEPRHAEKDDDETEKARDQTRRHGASSFSAPVRRLGREQPEPLVGTRLVRDLLRDTERVVLRPQEHRGRLFADHGLDSRVDLLAPGLVDGRAALVDELVETLDPRIVLADPAAALGVIERVQPRVGSARAEITP